MRRNTWLVPIRFVLIMLIALALSTWIDPYLDFSSPWAAQAVNAVLPVIMMLLVWAIGGRAWLALVIELALLLLLRYADHLKVMYLNTDLVYADLTVLGGLLGDPHLILGFVHPSVKRMLELAAAVVAVVLIAWFTRHRHRAGWKFRVVCLVVAVGGVAVIATQRAPDVIHALSWQVYAQPNGARKVGIAGNMLLGRMTARDVDRKPNGAAEKAFWHEPAVRHALAKISTGGNDVRPDIVILQSESMFEPSQLNGFANGPVLKHLAQEQPDLPGNLHVPVFGGRTLQTEFEVLTGTPLSFYPGAMFAYYGIIKHRFAALPYVLGKDGYRTIAIHPNERGFWRRGVVFPEMGFQSFQDINSFRRPHDFSGRHLVSDHALMRAILAALDGSNRATFIMAISINNHGPWGQYAPDSDIGLGLPAKVRGWARKALADYVEHAIDEDNAYGFLLKALARRHRPAVVVTYGDHLPALPRAYKQLGFKDGKPPPEHLPPYRIWANFPMPTPPAITSAYLLQGWLMHVAGLPLKGHVLADYLAGAVAHDPRVPAKVKQRVLREYANIAAANVDRLVPSIRNAHTVFIDHEHAFGRLRAHRAGPVAGLKTPRSKLHFAPGPGQSVQAVYDLDGDVASLTLRPFLTHPLRPCPGIGADGQRDQFHVTGDGRTLYRAPLMPQGFRLATLNVQGIKRLAITVTGRYSGPGANGCAEVVVKVPQMLCFSGSCTTPGPALPAASPVRLPSRTLTSDPMLGDIAHLAAMRPLAQRADAGKIATLKWVLRHEIARQNGASPFQAQSDGRLFMPPGQSHAAWIKVNVTGLDRIVLTPRIRKLKKYCLALSKPGKEVGLAKLALSLDGRRLMAPITVDQHYHSEVALDVKGGHTLRVEVTKGSSVDWCDWFSVGFPKLDGPAAPRTQQRKPARTTAVATSVAAPAQVVAPSALERPFDASRGAIQRNYPSASQEAALQLAYPLFMRYAPDSVRLTPFFPGTSSRPLSVALAPDKRGYRLELQTTPGKSCRFPVSYRLQSRSGKTLVRGEYKGSNAIDLPGWGARIGAAALMLRMAENAKNNFNCNIVVTRR